MTKAFVHSTAIIDEDVVLGAGSKVWHFSHVLFGSHIGDNCILGQSVMIGPDVTIGSNCKIQNNAHDCGTLIVPLTNKLNSFLGFLRSNSKSQI